MTVKGSFLLLCLSFVLLAAPIDAAAPSAARLNPPVGGAVVAGSIGSLLVPSCGRLALELVREGECDRLCGPVGIEGWSLLDRADRPVQGFVYDDPPDMTEWLAVVSLLDPTGVPLPPGPAAILVRTTAGAFRAELQITEQTQCRPSAAASGWGLSLAVYRLLTERDAGGRIDLCVGDSLMVVLQGRPVTGYEWSAAPIPERAVLQPIGGPEFRPTSMETGMVGAGGLFISRYRAIDAGTQTLRFVYARAGLTTDSDRSLEFDITVR